MAHQESTIDLESAVIQAIEHLRTDILGKIDESSSRLNVAFETQLAVTSTRLESEFTKASKQLREELHESVKVLANAVGRLEAQQRETNSHLIKNNELLSKVMWR